MSLEAWFWLILITVLSVESIRQFRKLLAMHDEFIVIMSNNCKPREGEHAADSESL